MSKALLLAPMSSVHERFNIANINALKELGCDIHLAANFEVDAHSREYGNEVKNRGISIHNIPFERASLKKNFACIPSIKNLLKEEKFDIVHCHTETGGILTRFAMTEYPKAKYLYTPHGMSFYKGSSLKSQCIYKPIEKFICSKMDINFAMNSEEYSYLCKWNKSTAEFVHGAGVDFEPIFGAAVNKKEKCKEFGIPDGKKILLSVGELNENKNHTVILKALSKIPEEKRPHLIICGVGELREQLEGCAKELNVGKNVTFAGYRYDIPEIVNIADIFVFPSFHEGLSVALMQAMAAGLPVVCSKIRGNVDLIENNKGGFLVNPDDEKGFYQSITDLLNDESLRKCFGEYNRNKVTDFSVDRVTEELYKVYDKLLKN